MDKLKQYRDYLHRILRDHQEFLPSSENVERLFICDEKQDHFILMDLGWEKYHRLDGIVIYARIRDGKIWVEVDWTEKGIATELLKAGVSNEDIVLAFHAPEKRQYTEFAVA